MSALPMRSFQARYQEFGAIRDYLASAGPGLAQATRHRVVLMVEELFCNSIEHGYGGESDQPVWVELACDQGSCRITYQDCAPAHDPFQQQQQQQRAALLDAGVEARPVGGLGVLLLLALSNAHRYQRLGDRNVIEVVVPCGESEAGG